MTALPAFRLPSGRVIGAQRHAAGRDHRDATADAARADTRTPDAPAIAPSGTGHRRRKLTDYWLPLASGLPLLVRELIRPARPTR